MRSKYLFRYFTFSLLLIGVVACDYEDYPDPIWDPNAEGEPTPTITTLDPASVAYEGITKVTITGQNFSSVLAENQVTFNGIVAEIEEATFSNTQLVVTVPVVISDASLNAIEAVQIMVAVQGAYAGAIYDSNFRVERAVIEWGGFIGEQPGKVPNAVACDLNENVYVAAGDKILYKIDNANVRTEFGTGLSSVTNDLKVGPNGFVYFARNNPYVYRIDPAGGAADRWHRVGKKIACFDFNEDQNIYCAGTNDSLYFVDVVSEANLGVALAEDYSYTALRVYDGYVYLSGTYEGADVSEVAEGIWRYEILSADGILGTRELVVDWSAHSAHVDQHIHSIMFESTGLLYVGVSETYDTGAYVRGTTILVIDPSTGESGPFYASVLYSPATSLVWGNSNFIYAARTTTNTDATGSPAVGVFRISQTKLSAVYNGRL